eukprot:scaffold56168_cov73-Phaeocystis_antarctica.AAC.4
MAPQGAAAHSTDAHCAGRLPLPVCCTVSCRLGGRRQRRQQLVALRVVRQEQVSTAAAAAGGAAAVLRKPLRGAVEVAAVAAPAAVPAEPAHTPRVAHRTAWHQRPCQRVERQLRMCAVTACRVGAAARTLTAARRVTTVTACRRVTAHLDADARAAKLPGSGGAVGAAARRRDVNERGSGERGRTAGHTGRREAWQRAARVAHPDEGARSATAVERATSAAACVAAAGGGTCGGAASAAAEGPVTAAAERRGERRTERAAETE